MGLRTILFLMACALLSTGVVHSADHPWDNKRIYYLIEYHGRLREKGYFVRRSGSFQRIPCVIYEEEKFSYGVDTYVPVRSSRITTITTVNGTALQRSEESLTGEPGREVVTMRDGIAEIEAFGLFGSPGEVQVPEGVLFEIAGEWLASMVQRSGQRFSAMIYDRDSRSVHTEIVTIVDQTRPAATGQPSVYIAEFSSEGRGPMLARFTSDGRLLRLESEGLVYQVVGREEYEAGQMPERPLMTTADMPPPAIASGSPVGITPAIPIGEAIPAWDTYAWLVLEAEPSSMWQQWLMPSEYAQVDHFGAGLVVTTLRNAPRVDADAVLPMAVPADIQPFLRATDAIPATSQAIIDAAYGALADDSRQETNVLRVVSYLAGWVHQNVAVEEWTGYESGARDTLTRRSGDPLGHARLFAGMARAVGIPARICQGFLTSTGRAVFHCWAEAWINGGWIPVDTTVSRVGLPAGYVLVERETSEGTFTVDFAGYMSMPGISLNLLSAGRETPSGQLAEMRVGDRRTYAVTEGDWMANLYWGFAVRLPPAWSGSARLNSVEITSSDGRANIRCEALPGDFSAGRADLDASIASLRGNLDRFRLIDSRVVSFDPEGATPALFMDFTCYQNGLALRCRQYILPRRQRVFRISFWAPVDIFTSYTAEFDSLLATFEY